jgi:hypothetical protein
MKKIIIIITILSGIFFSCKKSATEAGTGGTQSLSGVYIVGSENATAKYWQNGVGKFLNLRAGAVSSVARGVVVANGNVYMVGEERTNIKSTAVYWRNDTAVSLSANSSNGATANCIAVSGANIYIGGYEAEAGNTVGTTAKVWKNGVPISLTDGLHVAEVLSITIVGSDVYAAGYEYLGVSLSTRRPKYWRNGTPISIGNDTEGWLSGIVVSGNDVYVAGYELNPTTGVAIAKYWKNGVGTSLSNGVLNNYGLCLMVSGSDVYVGGYERRNQNIFYTAKYWKNNTAGEKILEATGSQDAIVNTGFINGNDVYFAGVVNIPTNVVYKARIWKNGVAIDITDGTKAVDIYGLFVAP